VAKALDSDPSHKAGEWREAALLGMRRDPRELENFVGYLGIQLGWGNRRASGPSGLREPTSQRVKPGIHRDAHRITNR
jgi:hypothetical protein